MKASLVLLLLLSGCALSPMRLFQAKVPEPVLKAPVQLEAERASADLIARKLETPIELRPVAAKLSASLGAPMKPFDLPTVAQSANAASSNLDKGMVDMQKQLTALNLQLATYQGKTIEGTGLSLLGPGMATIVIGLIVLGVVFPPAFTMMGFAYKRLKATASIVVDQLDQAAKAPETAAAVQAIKSKLSSEMDTAHKQVIHALQRPTNAT